MNQRPLFLFIVGLFLLMVGVSLFPRPRAGGEAAAPPTEAFTSYQSTQSYFAVGMVVLAVALIAAGIILQRRSGRR
jgi:drug/metabolite transporter (DMT)-like permease